MTNNQSVRVHNFNAGPGVLPLPVLEQAQAEMLNYAGSGMSVMEMSHRSAQFEDIIGRAESNLRALLKMPDNYKIIFLQGGATLQFAMAPANLRPDGGSADYVVSGAWGKGAFKEAEKSGKARVAWTGEKSNFNCLPLQSELDLDPNAAYLHFTANETIHGLEWHTEPVPPSGVPLVCDASSDFLSRPFDVTKYAMIYAGAQKNVGPAGVTVVIIRDDMLARTPPKLPIMLDYKMMADNKSLYNTPPAFAIYVVGLVLRWLVDVGGLEAIARRNEEKASLIYRIIDDSGGFYRGHARSNSRSRMNVTFRMPSEELENAFAKKSAAEGLVGLKGHRSVGGLRASLYNALPMEAAEALAQFMREFQRTNG
ncbi:MAG: 3-phosphoserine/phosphohydroxythreonine transaminase [Chloroflexi bacterium]|nr:3-phosphoserine/phosphohydroxythreonine transaminase [Chloroflexota bacterium]